jgi:hypothetical protein
VQVAVAVVPEPDRDAAEQPLIGVPAMLKLTEPEGVPAPVTPVTVAVRVDDPVTCTGFGDGATTTVVGAWATV